jgi:hypothetical protein
MNIKKINFKKELVKTVKSMSKSLEKAPKKVILKVAEGLCAFEKKIDSVVDEAAKKLHIDSKLLNALVKPDIGSIVDLIETITKHGARQFSLDNKSIKYVDLFRNRKEYPYKKHYSELKLFSSANVAEGYKAITLGNSIYFRNRPNEKSDLGSIMHEIVHSDQYFLYGKDVFGSIYGFNFLGNLLTKWNIKKSYKNLEFEKEATKIENDFIKWKAINK